MASAADAFQGNTEELLKGFPNVFHITNGILIVGLDDLGRNLDAKLDKVLKRCRKANLKLNKHTGLFRCTRIPFNRKLILHMLWVQNLQIYTSKHFIIQIKKKELQFFLSILNYLSKFLPVTAWMCEQLRKLTSAKADCSWNRMYQDSCDKAKKLITRDACMKFFMHKNPCT